MESAKEFNIEEVLELTMKNCNYYYNKEEGFRIDVVNAIKSIYKKENLFVMCEYSISDQGKSIDIVVKLNEKKYAIELKYRACRSESETQFEESAVFGKYRITRACNMYEYTDDIKSRILNESIKREFENVYAIILTNHSTFHNEQSIREYRRKRRKEDTELSFEECDNVNFEPIEIKGGYYNEYNKNHEDKKFKIMCASIKK